MLICFVKYKGEFLFKAFQGNKVRSKKALVRGCLDVHLLLKLL